MSDASKKNSDSPKYDNPPVIEVVVGVQFDPLEKLNAVHLGKFHEVWSEGFPKPSDQSPVASAYEQFGDQIVGRRLPSVTFDKLPLPRQWFEADNGNLIQLQRDRFMVNWRQGRDNQYTSFADIQPWFFELWGQFRQECSDLKLGEVSPNLLELIYINHIPPNKEYWTEFGAIEKVFPCWSYQSTQRKFLGTPSNVKWDIVFDIPGHMARLRISCLPVMRRRDEAERVRLDLNVKGAAEEWSDEGIGAWFNLAHEWIVRGFADITDPKIQKELWQRTK